MRTHQGKFKPRNPQKYVGDSSKIFYRSSWECSLCSWLDKNESVVYWSSEENVVRYLCPTDNKPHRYFIDFKIEFKNGDVYLIEVKPECQTKAPVSKKGKRKATLLKEVLTYSKNTAKWNAAKRYAEANGWKFFIWTEKTLRQLGVKLI